MELPTRDSLLARAGREVMACANFEAALDSVDFAAMHDVEALGEPGYSVENGVATIKVRGLLLPNLGYDLSDWGLTGYDILVKYAENAAEDSAVNAVLLDVDSPGGYVSGLSQAVAALDAVAAAGKPVATYASGQMDSAAYWLGSVGSEIAASEGAEIGSIGVYVEFFDRTKALESAGIIRQIFKSGFWKGAFSPYAPLSEKEKERLQADVEAQAALFFEHVASRRGLTVEAVSALDGDYFNAAKALEIGLIDQIMEKPTMSNSNAQGSAAATTTNPEPTFTQADLDAAVKAAADKAMADALAFTTRQAEINALDTTAEVKAMLASDKFQNVATEDLKALAAAMPKPVTAQLEAQGGAGIQADPVEFVEDKAKAKAEQQEAALAKLATLKKVL